MTIRLNASSCTAAVLAATLIAIAVPSAQTPADRPMPKFTVPAGFEVMRVAGPPLVDRPIVADFDDQGPAFRRLPASS